MPDLDVHAETALYEPPNLKQWLVENDPDSELIDLFSGAPDAYDFKAYVKLVPDEHLDSFLNAEASWKTDLAASRTTKESLGLKTLDPSDAVKKLTPNCVYRFRSGRMCGRETVPGVDRCTKHGGALIEPEVRRAILLSSYATIVEGSAQAVEALLDVAEHGRSEMARVQAAKELLDRAGLTAEVNLNVRIRAEVDAGAVLRERLDSMLKKPDFLEPEVIDVAEVVDVTDEAE